MTFNISDHIYYMTIFTDHDSNAGTAANGFAIVSGENGDTKEIELKKKQGNILIPPFKSGRYCTSVVFEVKHKGLSKNQLKLQQF